MSQIKQWFRTGGFRAIVTLALAVVMVLSVPAFGLGLRSAQAASLTDQTSSDKAIIQKIQQDAEDLGDSPDRPIGQTGLKNLKKLGENIKETVDLNVRQKGAIYNPKESDKLEALKEAQAEAESAAK